MRHAIYLRLVLSTTQIGITSVPFHNATTVQLALLFVQVAKVGAFLGHLTCTITRESDNRIIATATHAKFVKDIGSQVNTLQH